MKKIFLLLLIFTTFLCSCEFIDNTIDGECEIVYLYENKQVLIDEFKLSDIKLCITENDETYYINVTEDMLSESDLEILKTAGIHNVAIGYKDFIGFVTIILVDEINEDGIYKIINPYVGQKVKVNEFNISSIKIEVNINGMISYVNLQENMLSSNDIDKLKNTGKHSISFNYSGTYLSFEIELISDVLDEYTYDIVNTKSLLKISELRTVYENQEYSNYLDVASYIYHFHKLPSNYLTKSQAEALGWSGSGGNVWQNDSLYGKLIGGDNFYNSEGNLPSVTGYAYVEVDVNCSDGRRGSHRIVYNRVTWDIYYSDDHYDSFVYLIGQVK